MNLDECPLWFFPGELKTEYSSSFSTQNLEMAGDVSAGNE